MWPFSKNKSKPPPPPASPPLPANPGADDRGGAKRIEGHAGRIAFSSGGQTWEETFDCIAALENTLRRLGRSVRTEVHRVLDESTGLWLCPSLSDLQPIHGRGVRTCTKLTISHPERIPQPIYEFQHSTGSTSMASLEAGFDRWAQGDLVALAESLRDEPGDCMTLAFVIPPRPGHAGRTRRVILGPVEHLRERQEIREESHPFCPCCLFSNSGAVFNELLNSHEFFAVRLLAMRSANGAPDADCRVNGKDFEPGKQALRHYVSSWPPSGLEVRKQYIIIQDAPAPRAQQPAINTHPSQ